MDGAAYRAAYQANIVEMGHILELHFSENDEETRRVVRAIRVLGLAAHTRQPEAMRVPAINLANLIAQYEPSFMLNPEKYDIILMAKMFLATAARIVELRRPMPRPAIAGAPALPDLALAANRPAAAPAQQQQPQLVLLPDDSAEEDGADRDDDSVIALPTPPTGPAPVPVAAPVAQPAVPVVAAVAAPAQPAAQPAVAAARRTMRTRRSIAAGDRADDDDDVADVTSGPGFDDKICDYCNAMVVASNGNGGIQMHTWKKHKEHIHKIMVPELVCTIPYCDYAGSDTARGRRTHEARTHGRNPPAQEDILEELDAGQCRYCATAIDNVASFKTHMMQCEKRDERASLGCTACDKEFHFIYDFVTHLRMNGGLTHGKPKLLKD